MNHVALDLRFNQTDIETTLQRLADELLPDFFGVRRIDYAKDHFDYRFHRRHRT